MPIALVLGACPAAAQLAVSASSDADATTPEQRPDPFERETPRSTVAALIRALAEQDYARAGNYFALEDEDPVRGATLARALQESLDAGGRLIPYGELSNEPEGTPADGYPPQMERVGKLGGAEEVPILLTRSAAEPEPGAEDTVQAGAAEAGGEAASEETPVWQIAETTIAALEDRAEELSSAVPVEEGFLVAGAPFADWFVLLSLLVAVFAGLRALSALILWSLRRTLRTPQTSGIYRFLDAALPPFGLLLAVVVFRIWGTEAPVSIVARQFVLRYIGIVSWVALAWFAIRLVDAVAALLTSRLGVVERRQAVSAITLARRAVKLIVLAIATVAILDTFGIDVTTGIAALGIGGLALALGAQKTVENLVGSVMVVADRPIEVGDFCRVGDVLGTVEDIGMRSTRIRTLDRTVVTIPNGDFSSRQIENYARRDRFLFNPIVGLEYGITPAQLRQGVKIIEQILEEHPIVSEDAPRATLKEFGPSSLDIEVFAYIEVVDYAESLKFRQELLMMIFERLDEAGLSVAFPTQTIYLREENGAAERTG
ncbi:mechanosensitive ion channel family protein [Altericroceibacterium xinjiangense]|uniref:mechanosensitive ion channel family protein n=1 Tax=Altericroceibacterium xinjiangense TaxID=762261 RepID=UPI001F49A56D|nr:mechanosensitive ion channel family protein [Altericroceibacterium xinjiangense]